jgi:hypothetical protein
MISINQSRCGRPEELVAPDPAPTCSPFVPSPYGLVSLSIWKVSNGFHPSLDPYLDIPLSEQLSTTTLY